MASSTARTYQAIGLMSGSSLDGLDIVHCQMTLHHNPLSVDWKLLIGETVPFSELWTRRLANLPQQPALSFAQTNIYLGYYLGELVNDFKARHQIQPDFIASHGHTIYHYPDKRFTCQIGDGGALAATTGCRVVCNFRTQDIALSGEGTPIAPAADRFLFSGYDFYLNIGGIANITGYTGKEYLAFDTAPANQIFNALAQLANQDFDLDGNLAAAGLVIPELYEAVSSLPYFHKKFPKSLDNQWTRKEVLSKYLSYPGKLEDRMRTAAEVMADETVRGMQDILARYPNMQKSNYTILATGGGALNQFLIELLTQKAKTAINAKLILPELPIIQFKEAILMVLMGALRLEKLPNCFSSVTGAQRDSIGGAVYEV